MVFAFFYVMSTVLKLYYKTLPNTQVLFLLYNPVSVNCVFQLTCEDCIFSKARDGF